MEKKSLKQYCDDIEKDFRDNIKVKYYKKYVPLFIKEASTKTRWEDWDKDVFKEFFERSSSDSSISSQQGYFDEKERQQIKNHWSELAPLLKKMADSQEDQSQWEVYQEIKMDKTFHKERVESCYTSFNCLFAT